MKDAMNEQSEVIVEAVAHWAWECQACGTYHDDNYVGFTTPGQTIRCLECGGLFKVSSTPAR